MPAHCAPVVIHKVPPHMSLLHILAILIWLAAVFRFLNHRYLQLPTAIGLLVQHAQSRQEPRP